MDFCTCLLCGAKFPDEAKDCPVCKERKEHHELMKHIHEVLTEISKTLKRIR